MEFRDAVKYLRSELGLTQVELAMGLNINAITVGRWENGRTLPTRSITAALMDYARLKGASKECLDILNQAINSAAKSKLDFSGEGLYAVEHASLRQLIDDAAFPIYVCDMETDELLYLNQKAGVMVGVGESVIGKKCYKYLMHLDAPCEFCHKSELADDSFKGYDAYRSFDGTTYHVQGKLIQWNGRKAQVRYVLGQEISSELRLTSISNTAESSMPNPEAASGTGSDFSHASTSESSMPNPEAASGTGSDFSHASTSESSMPHPEAASGTGSDFSHISTSESSMPNPEAASGTGSDFSHASTSESSMPHSEAASGSGSDFSHASTSESPIPHPEAASGTGSDFSHASTSESPIPNPEAASGTGSDFSHASTSESSMPHPEAASGTGSDFSHTSTTESPRSNPEAASNTSAGTDAKFLKGETRDSDLKAASDASTGRLILKNPDNNITFEQLKTIFENINGGVSVVIYEDNGATRLAYANDHYFKLFGYTREQLSKELKNPHDTVYSEDWNSVSAAISKVKETKQAATFRYRIVKRDKSIAHIRCNSSVTAIDGVNGNLLISILTDITESVQMEQLAIVSGHRLDAIMKNMDSAVTAAIINSNDTIEFMFFNDRFLKMLGYTNAQYQAEVSDPFKLVHPDDANAVRSTVLSLRSVGDSKEMQYRIITRDKKTMWVRMRISIMTFPDAEGPVQLAVYLDITDIVEAQEKLAAQHNQIVDLLNDTPSGIAIVEADPRDIANSLRTTFFNDRFFSYSGYDRDEYNALLEDNQMFFVFDEDIPRLIADTEKLCAGETGIPVDSTVRCHTKDGGYRWLLLTGQLVQRRGDICVIYIVLVDITARQTAIDRQRINEEMLRIAAETDNRAVIIYDAKNNTCRVESRILFSAEYGETFENVPQSLIDLNIVAPDSEDEMRALFARINDGEKEIRISLQLRSSTDRYEWFECNAATIYDAEGIPDHAVLVCHNITEQRIKEAVFRKWQQSIDARVPESYTLFRCNLSRDASLDEQEGLLLKITFPQEAISFNSRTKLYAEEFVYPDDREAYIRLMDLDSLLTRFYRGEHSTSFDYRETSENEEVLWRRLTVETVENPNSTDVQAFLMYEDIDEEKKAEIAARELSQSDPLTGALNRTAFAEKIEAIIDENPNSHYALIMLDMDGFKQLNDTFGHAAGDQALQEVTAVMRSYARSGDLVCRLGGDEFMVWLRDIPYDAVIGKTAQQMCEHIRKAYSQEVLLSASAGIAVYPRDGSSYDELYRKADQALYKVKQTSKGSYAFFSVIGEEMTAEITEALSEVSLSPKSVPSAKRRMLIVDSNETGRLILKNFFKDEYLIETAKNGTEALIRLRHFGVSISVVLLDIFMPDIDGFTVLRRMQNDIDLRTIPVVVVTGDEEHSTLLKAFELGAAEYVSKPVDADIIRMRVQSVISKAENERLRAQNSYLMLQRNEEIKYRTVLNSTGTVVIEYDWHNHVFIYDSQISKHIAGNFDHRRLWHVFLSDRVANSSDVKYLQNMLIKLARNKELNKDSKLVKLKTPEGDKHWFRMIIYKNVDDFGLAEKMIITFNDVHDEVLANNKLMFQATHDELTGLYNRTGFLEKAAELIAGKESGYYVMACVDIEKFQIINDQYGTEVGDEVLKHIAAVTGGFAQSNNGICCRYMADEFAILYPANLLDTVGLAENQKTASTPSCISRPLRLRIGRYLINDTSLSISAMFDRAAMAETLAKGRYDTNIVYYNESMRDNILKEQQVVIDMVDALKNGEFEPWFQPQYNHATGALIGAEALVRWRKNGKIVQPNDFILVFEKNGFIYEVDQYIWRQVCDLLRRWLDEGKNPLPVSVNISRYDMFQADFVGVLTGLIAEYQLPAELLRLEITESAFSANTNVITDIAGKLIAAGFTVEIDDFGSGYSSLNTLKDVPASILKLDMRFFEITENSARGGNIVEAIVRMAKWLDMKVIAEGVEDKKQADYLKSIGCYYIQGYYYSKPLPVNEYERKMTENPAEHRLSHLETLESLDSDLFWDPKSMETLIFNSYVGGACIFEFYGGKAEILRYNDQYVSELHGLVPENAEIQDVNIVPFLDSTSKKELVSALQKALDSGREASSEMLLTNGEQKEYVRQTSRVIAKTTDRTLYYSVIQNLTDQRKLERERTESAERLSVIMSNVNGGVSAIEIDDVGTSRLVFHNDKYYDLYGYTRTEQGEQEPDPMSFIIPEDFPNVMEKIKKLKADGQPMVIDYGIIKQDGSRAQIRANASLMSMEGYGPIIASVLTDVTEQRTMEEQLRAIVDNINGGIAATYLSGDKIRFILTNDKYFELLGYTRKQYDAEVNSVFDLIHPDDCERVKKLFMESVQAETSYTMEYRIIRRNGAVRHILCNANIMHFFGIKEPIQLSVFNDTTLLREAQLKEQELTLQMQTIMGNIQGGVTAAIFHEDGNVEIAFANEGYYELFDYTKEQLEAEVPNVFDLILPEDRDKIITAVAHTVRERGSETYEYRCRKRDGSVIWVQTTNTVVSLMGVGDTVLLGITTDITELRRAEEQSLETAGRLSAVMNAMTNGMSAVAFSGRNIEFLFANDRYYQLHDTEKESCKQDKLHDALELVYLDDRMRISKIIMQTTEIGQSTELEYRIKRHDGTTRWIKAIITVTTLVGVDKPVQVAIYTDITEEKETGEQIRFLNESAGDILAQPDSEKAINDTLQKLLLYFAGERTYIFELNDESKTSDNTYEICAPGVTSEIERLQGVPYDTQQYWFDAFQTAGFVIISDIVSMDDSKAEMRELLLSQGIRSIIVAPLWRDGKLIGYLGVDNPTEAVDQVSQLIALADYIAVLMTRRDLVKTVERERQTVQQLMDDTPGGFIRMELFEDKYPTIVTVNDGLCKMLDMTRDELMEAYGDNVFACLADEDAAAAPEEMKQAYDSGGQYTSTCRLRKKGGDLFWVMLFGRFVHEEVGKLYLNAYFTDITEQKNLEQLQSELLENLPSGVALYEFNGEKIRTIHINRHYWELVGRPALSEEEISVFGVFHPDDRALVIDELKSSIRQERNAACIARILCGDGSYKPFSVITNNVREKNGNYLLYTTFTRISEEDMAIQKMLPVALSTIVSNTDAMSYVKDKDLRYICVSQSIAEMAGAKSPRDLIGKTAGEAFDHTFSEKFDDDDRLIIETGKPVMRMLEHIPTKDGSVCLARTTKFPILDAAGSAIGVYCVSHDITAQKEKESQLELLTDTIPGGLAAYSISNEGITTLYFNDGFFDYSGYTREEYIELTEKEPLALMLPEDRNSLVNMVRDFVDKKEDGMTGSCTYRCRTRSGEIRWMSLNAVLSQVSEDAYVLNAVQLDITERMNAEKRQTDLLDNLPFGAAMYEYDGKSLTALHINHQYTLLVNREVDYMPDDYNPVEGIHPDDRKPVFDEIRAAIAEGRNGMCDIRLLYGKDEYRSFHLDASIVPSGDGKYILYVAYALITDKEQQLKTATERLKLLSDSIPGGIATFRCMIGNIEPLYFNDGICRLTGYSREEFNNSIVSVLDLIFDEDKPIIRKQIELLMKGEKALDYSLRIHIKTGGYKWVECVANVTGQEGDDIFIVSAVLTDVTAHQEERERLRVSEELSRLAIDQSGKIITRYDVASRTLMLPYTLPDIFILPRVLENMPEEQVQLGRISPDTADAYCGVFTRINNGEASGEAIYQQNSTLGWRWLKSLFTTVFANDGKPVSAVITFEDITEQREKEAIYTRWQNAMAERSEDSYTIVRCNLNKSIMHDSWEGSLLPIRFTNPAESFNSRTAEYTERFVYADDRAAFRSFLNSDTMLAEYYRGHRSDSIDYRELTEDGSFRWLRLTVDLVEYPDSTDVEAYLLYENIHEKKHAELSTIRRAETDPLTGVLNRAAFEQRVNQVTSRFDPQAHNALFMLDLDGFKQVNDVFGHGAGDQTLTDLADALTRFCRKEDTVGRLGGDEFFVFFSDIGSAEVAAKKAQQICDMTRKALSIDVHISTSIGIALHPQDGDSFEALYKVADEALYRTKNAGKDGYCFSFGDPVIDGGTKWRGNQSATQKIANQKQKEITRRILIVDDNEMSQIVLEAILSEGYYIEKAMDGSSALTTLYHYGTAISVVLLDLMMPGMNGIEVLEKMQQDERTCTIPVIVVTSDEDRETALNVIRAGASDIITKPVDADLLRIRVESAVSKSENERLRAQNSYLAIRNTEVSSYRAALERTGTMIVMLDWVSHEFSYSPSISQKLAGQYDERPLWNILLSDEVTDEQTVNNMQQLVQAIVSDKERTEGSLKVRLKTKSGLSHIFNLNVFKEPDDYSLMSKIIMTLNEAAPMQK